MTEGISSERLEVLRMVQTGTITPDEGARLLESLDRTERREAARTPAVPEGPRNVRIQVTSSGEKNANIDIVLPLGIAEMGLALANRFAPGRVPDASALRETIRSGYVGKLIDIQDGEDHVMISVEPRR
ncbi:MAG TPA: hypothetical protein VNZ58_06520 [Thermomicrobiales bacterium]|nr:hypothetical protein [Thermomicrobiales bacterium]